jgi:hypothetical protein
MNQPTKNGPHPRALVRLSLNAAVRRAARAARHTGWRPNVTFDCGKQIALPRRRAGDAKATVAANRLASAVPVESGL